MAVQGGCDVRAKECKPCGRQTRVGKQRQEGRREKEKYDDREVSRKRMRGRKWVTDGESVTVRRNEDIKRG